MPLSLRTHPMSSRVTAFAPLKDRNPDADNNQSDRRWDENLIALDEWSTLIFPMTDRVRFEQLILAHHPCVTVTTSDEAYILTLLREITIEAGREMWQWSFTNGL